MLRLLPTDVMCEIVSHSNDFACDYYPTEQIFLYPVNPVKYYGHDPITRKPTLLFKTIYVTVKEDGLPVGGVGYRVRNLPMVRKVVFYMEKKPRDVVRKDFPIHVLQKRMDPHWDLKTVNDMDDLPTQWVPYQQPVWRARKIRLHLVVEARQLIKLFNYFDRSVRYPIKLVQVDVFDKYAPIPRGAGRKINAIMDLLTVESIRNYISQVQIGDRAPSQFLLAYKYQLQRIHIPGVEEERLGRCFNPKVHMLSTKAKKRMLERYIRDASREKAAVAVTREDIERRIHGKPLTFASAPKWSYISWESIRNRPDINILLKTFFGRSERYNNKIITPDQRAGLIPSISAGDVDVDMFNKNWRVLGLSCSVTDLYLMLWTRYLRTHTSTSIHIISDEIGVLLRASYLYSETDAKYRYVRRYIEKWSRSEQWASRPVLALIAHSPGHVATLAYFRSTNSWIYYNSSRFMTFKHIGDIVYLLNQYVNPSDPDPTLCASVDSPGQKREIFWKWYGECTLHAAGRLELLSQGIFDPMVAVDTTAVRQRLISIVGVYGGFLAIHIEGLLRDLGKYKINSDILWRRHEADVRELYMVNPVTRQNIKRLYPMHSFDTQSTELDDLIVSPVSGVVEESAHADFEDGSSEDWLKVYIRGPHDAEQDDHRLFAPTPGVLTYTTRQMHRGDTLFEADPAKLGVLIVEIGSVEFRVFVGRGYVTDEIRMDVQSGDEVQKGQVIGEIIVRPGNSRAEITVPNFIWDDFLSEKIIGLVLEGGKTVIGKK